MQINVWLWWAKRLIITFCRNLSRLSLLFPSQNNTRNRRPATPRSRRLQQEKRPRERSRRRELRRLCHSHSDMMQPTVLPNPSPCCEAASSSAAAAAVFFPFRPLSFKVFTFFFVCGFWALIGVSNTLGLTWFWWQDSGLRGAGISVATGGFPLRRGSSCLSVSRSRGPPGEMLYFFDLSFYMIYWFWFEILLLDERFCMNK